MIRNLKRTLFMRTVIFLTVSFFLLNSLTVAGEISPFHSRNSQGFKLAVEPLSSNDISKVPAEFMLVWRALEKTISEGAEVDANSKIEGLVNWLKGEQLHFVQYGNEVFIYDASGYLIRFYDAENPTLGNLFAGEALKSLVHSSESKTSANKVEIYKTSGSLPVNHNPALLFDHIIEKAGLQDVVDLQVGEFPLRTPDEHAICALQPDGTLIVHTLFLDDHKKIRESGLGFPYTFSDGETRWIDIANSIVYRVAMHEFKLDGRQGHGHGYLDENGEFQISYDEEKANTVGRRYSTVDDAAYLWYLHSYKETDEIKYDNKKFKERINWIFYDDSEVAKKARGYFPSLVKNEEKREEAIRLALLINEAFFAKRREAGFEVFVGRDEKKFKSGHYRYLEKGSVFAEGDESKLPEEVLESEPFYAPHIFHRNKPERELNERAAEKNAAIDYQKDIAEVIARLDSILARYKLTGRDQERKSLESMTSVLLDDLRALYKSMPVKIYEDRKYNYYINLLKELRKRRDKIYRGLDKADDKNDVKKLRELNLQAIRINRDVLKLQIMMVGYNLIGRSKQDQIGLRIGIIRSLLIGAYNSAKLLEEELDYRAQRLAAQVKKREIETTDWDGNIVRTFRLGTFDIEVLPAEADDVEPRVIMKQQRWINVNTHLETIRLSVKKGEIKKALEKLDLLIKLYNVWHIVVNETYKDITVDLKAIRDVIKGLPDAHAPPAELIQDVKGRVEALKLKIKHPKQRVWMDITYSDLVKSFRSKLHTILESYPFEYARILRNRADLNHYNEKIDTAVSNNGISKRNLKTILAGLQRVQEWADGGFVREKQTTAIDLKPAITILEGTQESGIFDSNQFTKVKHYIEVSHASLVKRLDDVDRIVGHEKRRAAELFSQIRDEDITTRMQKIDQNVDGENFEAALETLDEVRETYFDKSLAEPGYIRIEHNIRLLANIFRGALKRKPSIEVVDKIHEALDLVKEDIQHKNSFRITVYLEEKNEAKHYFINPGTTLLGLIRILKRDPEKVKANVGSGGWVSIDKLSKIRLTDEKQVRIAPKSSGSEVRASGGEGIKGKGPGTSGYEEKGGVITTGLNEYVDSNQEFLSAFLNKTEEPVLLRIPVEILEVLSIKAEEHGGKPDMYTGFLQALQDSDKGVVELFSVQKPSKKDFDYAHYGLKKHEFGYDRTKSNTITFMVTFSNEDDMQYGDIIERIGFDSQSMAPGPRTIIMPVGLYGKGEDLSGLIRSSVLGLRMVEIARKEMTASDAFVKETLDQFRMLCGKTTGEDFDLREEDLVRLATGRIGDVIRTLKKMVRLLPILPIDAEELYKIYENARKVLLAA